MSTPDHTDAGLVVRGVGKTFRDHPVLRDVDLHLQAGTLTAVTGSNGAGKSTLLRCLAGLARHTGTATFDGQPLSHPRVRALMAYLPQDVVLPPTTTVEEAMNLFARLRRADARDTPVPDGFLPPADRPLGKLSGGQQQRVVVAAALLARPRLVLLDEPDANLDPDGCHDLWAAVSGLRDQGAVILVATPRPQDLQGWLDAQVVLESGRVARTSRQVTTTGAREVVA